MTTSDGWDVTSSDRGGPLLHLTGVDRDFIWQGWALTTSDRGGAVTSSDRGGP